MKNLLLLLLITFILTCCNNDDKPFVGKDQLPPETQIGANTVGCLVNGNVYLPSQRGTNYGVNCFYQFVDGEFYFTMGFADENDFGPTVFIQTRKINLQIGQIYTLNKNMNIDGDFTGGGAKYWDDIDNISYTSNLKIGELKITRLDLSNSIISGIFWFYAVNSTGEVVEIREGRFDWNY